MAALCTPPPRLGRLKTPLLAFLLSGAFCNSEKKSCPHAACASVLRACLCSLTLFTGKALFAYGRAERSVQARGRFKLKRERRNILNLKNREKSKIITHTKQNRSHSHALAIPPTKFFRPALGSKFHVVDLDLSGFSRASFSVLHKPFKPSRA